MVSDTHLSSRTPEAQTNWDAVVRYVDRTRPDLVIHMGDLCLDGTNDVGDLEYARCQLDRLTARWHAVPGNHDIGDNPAPGVRDDVVIDKERRQRWLDAIGADYWCTTVGAWMIVAVNAQLFGSGLDAEEEQWSWAADQFALAPATRSTALVTHKPLIASDTELASSPPYRFVPPRARSRLGEIVGERQLDLVLSGHVHQYRVLDMQGTRHVWAPTTWAVLPEQSQPTFGQKRCGVVTLELDDSPVVKPQLVEPDGLVQLTLTENVPSPYAH
jgi:3',5'-cyclic AMP phosphodiesterase CpdA